MNKHTPGPWRVGFVVDEATSERFFYVAAGRVLEKVINNRTYSFDEHEVVEISYSGDIECPEGGIANEADARLIAAAPKLLDALLNAMPYLSGDQQREARLAIQEAIG